MARINSLESGGAAIASAVENTTKMVPQLEMQQQMAPGVRELTKGLDATLNVDPNRGIRELAAGTPRPGIEMSFGGKQAVPDIKPETSNIGGGGVEGPVVPAATEQPEPINSAAHKAEQAGNSQSVVEAARSQQSARAGESNDNKAATPASENAQKAEPQNEVKPVTEQNKSQEEAERANKVKQLEEAVKNKTATVDQIKELRELKQDPEVRRQALEQKALDGTITDQEAQELGNLNTKTTEKLTPEQQAEELKKQVDELGTRIMDKLANGESITAEDLEQLRDLRAQESLINQGFSPEDSKAVVDAIAKRSGKESGRQIEAMKEIKDKIQELMSIELQLMSIPKQVDALRKQRKTVQQDAQKKHQEAASADTEEARLQKKGEEYGLYMQIANINAAIVEQKYKVPLLEARRKDLEQYVRRKLGVTGGFTAFMEWADAKVTNVATEVGVGVAEEADYVIGNY